MLGCLATKLAPRKKDRFVFTSFAGHYSDNPRYVSEAMRRLAPEVDIVWLVTPERMKDLPADVRGVPIGTLRAGWVRGTAAALVDNVYGDRTTWIYDGQVGIKQRVTSFLQRKKGQPLYTTFHGTPLKHIGCDQIGSRVTGLVCPEATLMPGNEFSLKILEHVTFGRMRMLLTGSPRNDLLFCGEEEREVLRAKLGLPEGRRILLYAPTFRGDGADYATVNLRRSGPEQLETMDPERLCGALTARFGGEWTLVCRLHYHAEKAIDWQALEEKYPGRYINGNTSDDMAEWLACADALITDASSCMFDFMLTGRPCLLYFPDFVYYGNQERGFYMDPETLPFPLSMKFEDLLSQISTFDAEAYRTGVEKLLQTLGNADRGDAAEKIAALILKEQGIRVKELTRNEAD